MGNVFKMAAVSWGRLAESLLVKIVSLYAFLSSVNVNIYSGSFFVHFDVIPMGFNQTRFAFLKSLLVPNYKFREIKI